MKSFITMLILLAAISSLKAIASDDKSDANSVKRTIRVGQSLKDVRAVLDASELPHGEGGFAFAKMPDQSNLYVHIDPNHATACIYFSESKQLVTGIHMVFFRSAKTRSKTEPMVPATAVTFAGDGVYTVVFSGSNRSAVK